MEVQIWGPGVHITKKIRIEGMDSKFQHVEIANRGL